MNTNHQLDQLCLQHFQDRAYVADGIFYHSNADAWETVHPKVLFVLKQPNSDDLLGEDYREYDFDTCMENSIWKELLARLYGIMHTSAAGYPSYQKATETASIKAAFERYPLAMINIIKDVGTGETSGAVLGSYARAQQEFLARQIDILQPDIIVCCGSGVFDAMNQAVQPSIESSGNWLKYNPLRKMIFFDTYHPSGRNSKQILREAYEMPLQEYAAFLRK